MYTWAHSTWEAEAGRRRVSNSKPSLVPLRVQSQPRLYKEGKEGGREEGKGREEIVKKEIAEKEIGQNVTLIKLLQEVCVSIILCFHA